MNLYDKQPMIAHDVWVAPNATVIGDVEICNDASVWYNVVIRGAFQFRPSLRFETNRN
jgi:gamma-carbonic anhydrase